MAKSNNRIIILGLVILMCLGILCACDKLKYHAELYQGVDEYLSNEFLANEVYGFDIENRDPYLLLAPKESKTFIIFDNERLDEIFVSFPYTIDFDKQMIVMEVRCTISPMKERKINSIKISDNCLNVKFATPKYSGKNAAASPQQIALLVIMDRLDVNEVIFENSF